MTTTVRFTPGVSTATVGSGELTTENDQPLWTEGGDAFAVPSAFSQPGHHTLVRATDMTTVVRPLVSLTTSAAVIVGPTTTVIPVAEMVTTVQVEGWS